MTVQSETGSCGQRSLRKNALKCMMSHDNQTSDLEGGCWLAHALRGKLRSALCSLSQLDTSMFKHDNVV